MSAAERHGGPEAPEWTTRRVLSIVCAFASALLSGVTLFTLLSGFQAVKDGGTATGLIIGIAFAAALAACVFGFLTFAKEPATTEGEAE